MTRRRVARSPLVVASTKEAAGALSELAKVHGIPIEHVVLDREGRAVEDSGKDRLAEVEVLWCHGWFRRSFVAAAVERLPSLDWLHSDFVGIDGLPIGELARRGIACTNGAGNFARPMAEWVVLGLLSAVKQLPLFLRRSDRGEWGRSPELDELSGKVVLLIGLGDVNRLVAELLVPFGCEVRATTRRPRDELPAGVHRLVVGPAWRDELRDADFVVLGTPLTEATRNLLDREAIAAMKPGVFLVNPARGALIDEAALIEALDAGKIGGALLDTFVEEPLPDGHSLWGRPNVLIVPHHTWSSPRVHERQIARFATELGHWLAGEPLERPVDLEAGY